ncbi:MAG: hypothetical protein ABSD20_05730 [Terriglobales bacterium]|jgi:hypothetical protein
MTIQIEVRPEILKELAAGAQKRGVAIEEFAQILLQNAIAAPPEPQGRLSIEELHTMLAEIAEGAENLPELPTNVFTRESYYEDQR